jgi:hypothetical protein
MILFLKWNLVDPVSRNLCWMKSLVMNIYGQFALHLEELAKEMEIGLTFDHFVKLAWP